MIIRSVHIDRFGKWNGLRLQNLEGGINLFYGPNETGKTTLMQFLRTIFYGFSEERLAYVYPTEPERTGGRIQILTEQGEFTVARHLILQKLEKDTEVSTENEEIPFFLRSDFRQRYLTQTLEDGLKITDGNGARQDTFWWRNFIGLSTVSAHGEMALDTDEMLFNNIFAIGLQELQKLSVLNSTEASRQLYDLSTGVSRYSISQILGNLATNRERFLASDAVPEMLKTEDLEWCDDLATPVFLREIAGRNDRRSQELGTLLNYRQILEKQLENIQTQNKQYGKIHAERTALAERIRRLTEEIQQQKHKIRILEIAEQIQEEWRERSELDDAIIDFGKENPELADFTEQNTENLHENLKRVRVLKEEIRKLGESRDALRGKSEMLREERGKIGYQDALIQILPSFESLFQQQEWIENLRGRLEDLYRQQLDSEAQLAIDYRRIGLEMPTLEEGKTVPENIFPFSIRALRPLRTPSREMGRVRKQIQTVRKKRAQLLREAEENALKLGVYYRACKERCTGNLKIQELPGMENFPEAFLMQDADGTGKRRESPPKETLKEERNREKTTQNVLNSRVVNEIPEDILTQNGTWENAERHNALMDVNAASRLLGEVLATERRGEIHLQQLMQTLENIEKSKREEKETARKLTLSDSELFLIGGTFTLGLTLFLFTTLCMMGFLAPWGVAHVLFFLLGIVLAGGSVAWRVVQVRKIRKKLGGFQESLPSLEQQRNRLIRLYFTERETEVISLPYTELMTLCKREEEKGRERVAFLEAELKDAENACTLVAKRSALLLEARHLTERLRKLKGSYEDAKKRREEILQSLKLPENWSSANIRQLIDASDRIRELWRRRRRDLEDFRLYAQELDLLVKRLEKLLAVFGEDFTRSVRGGDARFPYVGNVFSLMEARLDEEKARKQSAENLERKAEEIRTEERKLKADFRKKTHACRQILERSGVENGKKLREKVRKLGELSQLCARRRELQKAIDAVVGFTCTESMIWEVYESHTPEQIAERHKILLNSLSENEFQVKSAQTRETECRLILEKIIADDSPTRIQYELQKNWAQIAKSVNSWRLYALTERLMETVQKTYQQKRQPKTLECASEFLREMTNGKYVKVWTPVDEDLLFVQRQDEVNFLPGQLSTGTRELLYLAIRLALIEEYRRRNIHLPIILDDVLVNFDRVRATSTARVLTKFAGDGTQIFFFTSHEHIREIFTQENALICDMSKTK